MIWQTEDNDAVEQLQDFISDVEYDIPDALYDDAPDFPWSQYYERLRFIVGDAERRGAMVADALVNWGWAIAARVRICDVCQRETSITEEECEQCGWDDYTTSNPNVLYIEKLYNRVLELEALPHLVAWAQAIKDTDRARARDRLNAIWRAAGCYTDEEAESSFE